MPNDEKHEQVYYSSFKYMNDELGIKNKHCTYPVVFMSSLVGSYKKYNF